MKKIRVAIADDHSIFRKGLLSVIEPNPDMEIVLETDNGAALLEEYPAKRPDICLLDVKMPGMDGITTTQRLLSQYPEARILTLSVYDEDTYVANMFEAGARGYLLKDAEESEILQAIRTVSKGEYYFRESISRNLFRRLYDKKHPSTQIETPEPGSDLSVVDKQVLKLICDEFTNAEIAHELGLSPKTVENYRNRLLGKTGAKNTAGLVTYAIRHGIVSW